MPRFTTQFRGTRINITPELISEVLLVPRVENLDYTSSPVLRAFSKDDLASRFCERPMS